MQTVNQETFMLAEQEGQLFLDHQVSTIQCINNWRTKVFDTFNLDMSLSIPRLQFDVQVIKRSLINPENRSKINFTLGQIGVMDILKMNFKNYQKRLKQFISENQENLSFNLISDLMKNTQILREYFNYDQNLELQTEQPLFSQQYQETNTLSEEDIQLEFNEDKNIATDTFNQNIKFEQEIQIDLDLDDNTNNTNINNSQEFINFFDQRCSNQNISQQQTTQYPPKYILQQ